jgi:outer membrane protein with beta-barrel domain
MLPATALAAMVLLGTEGLCAQTLNVGAKAGVNLATLKVDGNPPIAPFTSRAGLIVGGFVSWAVAPRIDLQPEALFSRKGASAEESGVTVDTILDYLDVPVLARYRLLGTPRRNLHVLGGPSLGVALKAKVKATFGGDSFEQDMTDDLKRFEFGLVAGAGVQVGRVSVEGRYTWGLSDTGLEARDSMKAANRVASILGGLRF